LPWARPYARFQADGDLRLHRGPAGEQAYALQETIDIAQADLPLPQGTDLVPEI
jgi:hypothetical protein